MIEALYKAHSFNQHVDAIIVTWVIMFSFIAYVAYKIRNSKSQ